MPADLDRSNHVHVLSCDRSTPARVCVAWVARHPPNPSISDPLGYPPLAPRLFSRVGLLTVLPAILVRGSRSQHQPLSVGNAWLQFMTPPPPSHPESSVSSNSAPPPSLCAFLCTACFRTGEVVESCVLMAASLLRFAPVLTCCTSGVGVC